LDGGLRDVDADVDVVLLADALVARSEDLDPLGILAGGILADASKG